MPMPDQGTRRVYRKKGCHFVVIPRLKQPKNNPNNDSLLLANYLILKNSVVETAGIEPASASTPQTVLHT